MLSWCQNLLVGVEDLNTCGKTSRLLAGSVGPTVTSALCLESSDDFFKTVQWARLEPGMNVAVTCGPITPPAVMCAGLIWVATTHGLYGWCRARVKGQPCSGVSSLSFCCTKIHVSWQRWWRFLRAESVLKQRDCVSGCDMALLGWFQSIRSGIQWWGLYWCDQYRTATEQICSFTAVLGLFERKITPFCREAMLVGRKPLKGNCHINWWSWSERVGGAGEEFKLELQEPFDMLIGASQGEIH